jgi:hypothetical protein
MGEHSSNAYKIKNPRNGKKIQQNKTQETENPTKCKTHILK